MNIIETNLSFGSMTKRTKTNRMILHHADATTCSAEDIHRWHKNNGWAGAGYHFLVRKNGKVYRLRPEQYVGAHASGSNSDSIGICFEGNFDKEQMCTAQINAGKELVAYLKEKYKISKVQRHKDVCSTSCPGASFPFSKITSTAKTTSPQVPGTAVNNNQLGYRAHCQSYGWLDPVRDGQTAGTTGKSKRMEALKIDVRKVGDGSAKLEVTAHIQGIGDRTYVIDKYTHDMVIGTVGQSKRIEAIAIKILEGLTGKHIKYRIHVDKLGWSEWKSDGEMVGSKGMSLGIQAIQIAIE